MTFPAIFNVSADLNGINAFVIASTAESFGYSVANTGDINNDGRDDLIVGTSNANQAFVVFGAANFQASLDTSALNGSNGFLIQGPSGSQFGISVSGAGDINGDGIDDAIVGSTSIVNQVNQAFVVFGAASFHASINTSSLTG